MPKASWNGATLAESNACVSLEGNQYFPADAIKLDHFRESSHTSICPWKGTAHYYDVVVNGQTNTNAAWYYPEPKPAAEEIKGRIAFWKGVEVS